jgi:hypothetical protein
MVFKCRADPVQIVDENGNPLGGAFQSLVITDEWSLSLLPDEAVGNSKVFDVPSGTEYQVLWVFVELTTTATVGDRQVQIDIRDNAGDIIGQIRPGATQAASLTYEYMFAPSLADLTAVRDTVYLMTPFPPTVFLPAFYSIRVFDNNNVDVLDTLNVQLMVASRSV